MAGGDGERLARRFGVAEVAAVVDERCDELEAVAVVVDRAWLVWGAGCIAGLAVDAVSDRSLLSLSCWALISSFLNACSALLVAAIGVNVCGRWVLGSAYFFASAAARSTASWPELSWIILLGAALIWLLPSGT
jgi:hypothetical protein